MSSNDGEEPAVIQREVGISGKQESQIVGRDLEIGDESSSRGQSRE